MIMVKAKRAFHMSWLVVGWMGLISSAFTVLLPTSVLYNPTMAQIDGTTVRVHHTFPLDQINWRRPWISYVETVTAANGHTCHGPDEGIAQYVGAGAFVTWDIGEWAGPCIGGGFIWDAQWTAYVGGVFPLRPVTLSLTVFAESGA